MRRSLVVALVLLLGVGACVDYDAKPPIDAPSADSQVIDARPPDGAPPSVDATTDAPMLVEQ